MLCVSCVRRRCVGSLLSCSCERGEGLLIKTSSTLGSSQCQWGWSPHWTIWKFVFVPMCTSITSTLHICVIRAYVRHSIMFLLHGLPPGTSPHQPAVHATWGCLLSSGWPPGGPHCKVSGQWACCRLPAGASHSLAFKSLRHCLITRCVVCMVGVRCWPPALHWLRAQCVWAWEAGRGKWSGDLDGRVERSNRVAVVPSWCAVLHYVHAVLH